MGFEEYKKNLASIEDKLASADNKEEAADIQIAISWIDYNERIDINKEERYYFLNVSLPKMIKALINKKRKDGSTLPIVLSFFEKSISIMSQFLVLNLEEMNSALKELLDPQNAFFLQHGKKRNEKLQSTAAAPMEGLINSLDVGSCLDCYNDYARWELAIIERFSDYRTEFEITWPNGQRQWFSVERDAHRMAPFGTRTGINDQQTQSSSEVGENRSFTPLEVPVDEPEEEDSDWRKDLKVGDLVDAQDKNFIFYQACILEIREAPEDSDDSALECVSPLPNGKTEPRSLGLKTLSGDVEVDDIYDNYVATSPEKDKSSTVGIAISEGGKINGGVVNSPKSKQCRIAFIGLSEKSDEWVDLFSDRIKPLNSKSKGRKGVVLTSIREEIIHLQRLPPFVQPEDINGEMFYAQYREGCFEEPLFINLVNKFGAAAGFRNLLSLLRHFQSENPPSTAGSRGALFPLIVAIGNMRRVLTSYFLERFADTFMKMCIGLFRTMAPTDIREIPVESQEPALIAIEQIALARFGRGKEAGRVFEPLIFQVALRNLTSPYLNRRLGGLKVLTELVRRAEVTMEHPSGLKITRNFSSGVETVNYRPISLLFFYDLKQLCHDIMTRGLLLQIFTGTTAHESLMARASSLVAALASQNCVDAALMSAMWEAGLSERKPEALQCLTEAVRHLDDLKPLEHLLRFLKELPTAQVMDSLIEIAAAIAMKCRGILMKVTGPGQGSLAYMEFIYSQNVTSPGGRSASVSSRDVTHEDMKFWDYVHFIHHESLLLLWRWIEDDSGLSNSAVEKCFQQIELVFDIGISFIEAGRTAHFPWAMQYHRLRKITKLCISNIRGGRSVVPALKVIHLVLSSWPFKLSGKSVLKDKAGEGGAGKVDFLPFDNPSRMDLARYLERKNEVIQAVTTAVVTLKKTFNHIAAQTSNDPRLVKGLDRVSFSDPDEIAQLITTKTHADLNDLQLGARMGYKDQLDKFLDFIHLFVRCSDSLSVPVETIRGVFQAVVYSPITAQEVDSVISFCTRVIIKVLDTSNSNGSTADGGSVQTSGSSTNGSCVSNGEQLQLAARRSTVASRGTILWCFHNLLCDGQQQGFLQSPFFSSKALICVDKWFRWLNSDFAAPPLSETPTPAAERGQLYLPELVGLEVFPEIIMTCYSEKVALQAVKLLTSIPTSILNTKKISSVEDPPSAFRSMLLSYCMKELEGLSVGNIRNDPQSSQSQGKRINRVLLLLDGILEESALNCEQKFTPHGTIGLGKPIPFRISSSSKRIQSHTGEITMFANDTVSQLFNAVAKFVQLPISDFKIFRLGKELSLTEQKNALVGELRLLSSRENLVVAERAHKKLHLVIPQTSNEEDGQLPTSSEHLTASEEKPVSTSKPGVTPSTGSQELVPALVLAQSKQYFDLLFEFLRFSEGDVCDTVWHLISRLPTSEAVLRSWAKLECDMVVDLLMVQHKMKSNRLADLLYNLQVIEMLMQPTNSAEDLEKQVNVNGNVFSLASAGVTPKELKLWSDRFLSKGGLYALTDAFEWLRKLLTIYTKPEKSEEHNKGVTPQLLQQTLSLLVKLLKSILLRAAAFFRPQPTLVMLRAMKSTLMKVEGTSDSTVPPIDRNIVELNENNETVVNNDPFSKLPPELKTLLKEEWGWRLNVDAGKRELQSILLGTIELDKIQGAVLGVVRAVRKLGEHEFFTVDATADLTRRNKVTRHHEAMIATLIDLMVLWSSGFLIKPTILLRLEAEDSAAGGSHTPDSNESAKQEAKLRVSLEELLAEVVMGSYQRGKRCHQVNAPLAVVVSNWLVEAISSVLCWASLCTPGEKGEQKTAPSDPELVTDVLRSRIFQTLLNLRPSFEIKLSDSKSPPQGNTNKSLLLKLAAALLENISQESLSAIPLMLRRKSCASIMKELETAAELLVRWAMEKKLSALDAMYLIDATELEGTVRLLVAIASGDENLISLLSRPNVFRFLLNRCLGLTKLVDSEIPIVANDVGSRKHFYALVLELVRNNPTLSVTTFQVLLQLHSEVSAPPNNVWDYRPHRESRSPAGYVGLRNLGSTCYMNSLLQVLYMNPTIREYLLEGIVFERNDAEVSPGTREEDLMRDDLVFQLQRLFLFLHKSRKKSFTPEDWSFAFKDETGINPINRMQQQDAQEFFQLLCERFERYILSYRASSSSNRGYRCVPTKTTENSPVDILHQTFGGKLCNQMFKSRDSGRGGGHTREIREQEEGFVCLSVEVKGSRDLQDSLRKFVAGDQISDYQWEEGCSRENITKRQCISSLPQTLLFHLKRFELNFDTFRREKVNDAFPFPHFVDMLPYTKEGLALMDRNGEMPDPALIQKYLPHPLTYYQYELMGVVVHTGTTDSGHYYSYLKEFVGENPSQQPAAANSPEGRWLEFNDAEVSVFSPGRLEAECFGGSTTSHEYIPSTQAFYSSETVNPKNAYMLVYHRTSAFRPPAAPPSYPERPIRSAPRTSLHQRTPSDPAIVDESEQQQMPGAYSVKFTHEDTHQLKEKTLTLHGGNYRVVSLVSELEKQVNRENAEHALALRVLEEPHIHFFGNLVEVLQQQATAGDSLVLSSTVVVEACRFIWQFLAHTPNTPLLLEFTSNLLRYLEQQKSMKDFVRPLTSPLTPPLPPTGAEPFSSRPVSTQQQLLADWIEQFETRVLPPFLSASKLEVRRPFAETILTVLRHVMEEEGVAGLEYSTPHQALQHGYTGTVSWWQQLMSTGLITNSVGSGIEASLANASVSPVVGTPVYATPVGDADFENYDDPDLALAIQMSKELPPASGMTTAVPVSGEAIQAPSTVSYPPGDTTIVSEGSGSSPATNTRGDKYLLLSARFLAELTTDNTLQFVAENWRKAAPYCWVLKEVAAMGKLQRNFLIRREAVSSAVDLILGEQSPLCGQCYPRGSRRRAPSSYVAVGSNRDGSPSAAATTVPDWTDLVEMLSILVCGSQLGTHETSGSPGYLSILDKECVMTKTLYSTLLKQMRYGRAVNTMIRYLSFQNQRFSEMITEVLLEEFMVVSAENTAHLFQLLEYFVSIPDSVWNRRYYLLFHSNPINVTGGNSQMGSLMELMFNFQASQTGKHRLVCVFLRSFVSLVQVVPKILDFFSIPQKKHFAEWSIRFSYLFYQKSKNSNFMSTAQSQINSAIENNGNRTFGPVMKNESAAGPFVWVYGESEGEREISWEERAEKTFQLLHSLFVSMGLEPNRYIPSAEEIQLMLNPSSASAGNSGRGVTFDTNVASQGRVGEAGTGVGNRVMTDEEYAMALQAEDLNNDID